MSGDLEDFLRRAAKRRQAKAAQQQQTQPAPRSRPEYSDRHRERVVDAIIVEEPADVEVVEEDSNSLAARQRRLEESKKAAAAAQAEAAQRMKKVKGRAAAAATKGDAAVALTGNTAHDLLRLLSQPGGIKQAILLREILDRPEHRW